MRTNEPTLADSQRRSAHGQTVSTGRGWILFVAIVQLLFGAGVTAFSLLSEDPTAGEELFATGIALVIFGSVFMGLYIWAGRNPFPAALTALILYLTLVAADAVLDPSNAFRGIIIKLFIIFGLAKAVQSGYELRKKSRY